MFIPMVIDYPQISSDRYYEISRRDVLKDKALKHGAWLVPLLLSIIPAIIFIVLSFVFGVTPPTAALFLFLGVVSFIVGLVVGLILSGILLYYRQKWLKEIRERIAVDGIKAEEVHWFKNEMNGGERRALAEMEAGNRLLADAYRETLASRLTATRIYSTTKKELQLVQRRQNKLKYLKGAEVSEDLKKELLDDQAKLEEIKKESKQMRVEAETRLQMIEAAARRGSSFADTETTLKKLSARSAHLPLALEALKMEEEIRRELMAEDELESKPEKLED